AHSPRCGPASFSPAAAVDDRGNGARLLWPARGSGRRLIAERDRADRPIGLRYPVVLAERAEVGLPAEATSQRAEAGVDRREEDQERGHAGVDIPVRDRPASLVAVRPPLIGLGVAIEVRL